MNNVNIPSGTWPVMITPFKHDGSVDYDVFESLIEFYINGGVAGLFACCGSSEIRELTEQEMLNISSTVIKLVNGRVPVVSGAILFKSMEKQVSFAAAMAQTGADTIIVAPTQFVTQDDPDEKLFDSLKSFTAGVDKDIPLGIYEYPNPYQRIIPNNIISWLAKTDRYVFFKDTCCDINRIRERLDILRSSRVSLFNANLSTLLDSMMYGCCGYCGTSANFCPELYTWLWDNFRSQPALAKHVLDQATKFNVATDICDNYPANAKAYLNMMGVDMDCYCRMKVAPVTEEHRKILKQISLDIAEFKKTIPGLQECLV